MLMWERRQLLCCLSQQQRDASMWMTTESNQLEVSKVSCVENLFGANGLVSTQVQVHAFMTKCGKRKKCGHCSKETWSTKQFVWMLNQEWICEWGKKKTKWVFEQTISSAVDGTCLVQLTSKCKQTFKKTVLTCVHLCNKCVAKHQKLGNIKKWTTIVMLTLRLMFANHNSLNTWSLADIRKIKGCVITTIHFSIWWNAVWLQKMDLIFPPEASQDDIDRCRLFIRNGHVFWCTMNDTKEECC